MAMTAVRSTIAQIAVGTTAVQLTAGAAAVKLQTGIRLSLVGTSALLYWGGLGVTTALGHLIKNGVGEIDPADVANIGDIYLISDTPGQTVTVCIVGQTVTIS